MWFWMAGIAAGVAHALSGPDHLAAVAPLAFERPASAWRLGLRWGAGHACAVGALGAVALLLRERIDLSAVSTTGEVLAGLALVGLGLWGWRRVLTRFVHVHEHEHDGVSHRHLHTHPRGTGHLHPSKHCHRHVAFGFGLLHGVASTSHVLGVIPALALPGLVAPALYVFAFAFGTLVAMVACGALLGRAAALSSRSIRAYTFLLAGAASASLIIGLVWILG